MNSKNSKPRSNLTSSMDQPDCSDRAGGVENPKIQVSPWVALPSQACNGRMQLDSEG
jgi:hypothetical protein